MASIDFNDTIQVDAPDMTGLTRLPMSESRDTTDTIFKRSPLFGHGYLLPPPRVEWSTPSTK
jgi:hypothetical protein